MRSLVFVSLVTSALLSAHAFAANCIDFTGNYGGQIEVKDEKGVPQKINVIMVVAQDACSEVYLEAVSRDGYASNQTLIVDGEKRVVGDDDGVRIEAKYSWTGKTISAEMEVTAKDTKETFRGKGSYAIDKSGNLIEKWTYSSPDGKSWGTVVNRYQRIN